MDLNLQNREENCFCGVHTDPSLNNSYQKLSSIYGNVNITLFCLTLKKLTLHFVDLERSLKSFLTSQNVLCLLTLFSSEEMALNVFWLIVHVHRNEKRVNDVTQ